MSRDSKKPQRLLHITAALAAALLPLALAAVLMPGAARAAAGQPRFFNYVSPPGTADDAGEPSIGINWTSEHSFSNSNGAIPNGGTACYFGGFMQYMAKVTFNDCQSPALAIWEQKPVTLPS